MFPSNTGITTGQKGKQIDLHQLLGQKEITIAGGLEGINKLAIARPGMIETRANEQTRAVFESIENDSKELDTLDDPSADINPDN